MRSQRGYMEYVLLGMDGCMYAFIAVLKVACLVVTAHVFGLGRLGSVKEK